MGLVYFRDRNAPRRHQSTGHHSKNAGARDDLPTHANVLLDGSRIKSPDRDCLSNFNGDVGHAAFGPVSWLSLFHQRSRWKHDDVYESDLGVGPSRGVYSHIASFRRLLRGGLDLFREAAVWLPFYGRGYDVHLHL